MKWFNTMSSGGKAAVVIAFIIFGLPVVSSIVFLVIFALLSVAALIFGSREMGMGMTVSQQDQDNPSVEQKESFTGLMKDLFANMKNINEARAVKILKK